MRIRKGYHLAIVTYPDRSDAEEYSDLLNLDSFYAMYYQVKLISDMNSFLTQQRAIYQDLVFLILDTLCVQVLYILSIFPTTMIFPELFTRNLRQSLYTVYESKNLVVTTSRDDPTPPAPHHQEQQSDRSRLLCSADVQPR